MRYFITTLFTIVYLFACEEGYTEIKDPPVNITQSDYGNCYSNKDLKVLKDIILKNKSLRGKNPLELGKQVWKKGQITSLFINNLKLKVIPSSIGNLKSLNTLNLQNNQIAKLPENIC